MKYIREYYSSIDDEVSMISDVLIMSFQDNNIDNIEEIESKKAYYPEETIKVAKRISPYEVAIDNVVFCIGPYYPLSTISGKVSTESEVDLEIGCEMRLCVAFNSRKLGHPQIERCMSRFYRRIVKFGWAKVHDKSVSQVGNTKFYNINLSRVKPKVKK